MTQNTRLDINFQQNHETNQDEVSFSDQLYHIGLEYSHSPLESSHLRLEYSQQPKQLFSNLSKHSSPELSKNKKPQANSPNQSTNPKQRSYSLPSVPASNLPLQNNLQASLIKSKEYPLNMFKSYRNAPTLVSQIILNQKQKQPHQRLKMRRIEKIITKKINQDLGQIKNTMKAQTQQILIDLKRKPINSYRTIGKELQLEKIKNQNIKKLYSHKCHFLNQRQPPSFHPQTYHIKANFNTLKIEDHSANKIQKNEGKREKQTQSEYKTPIYKQYSSPHSLNSEKQRGNYSKGPSINKILKKCQSSHQMSIHNQNLALRRQQAQGRKSLIKQLSAKRQKGTFHCGHHAILSNITTQRA